METTKITTRMPTSMETTRTTTRSELTCNDIKNIYKDADGDGAQNCCGKGKKSHVRTDIQPLAAKVLKGEDITMEVAHEQMVTQQTMYLYDKTTLQADKSLAFLTSVESGLGWLDEFGDNFSPEEFTMETVDSLSMVKYMQGDIFQIPTTGNKPDDVNFALPAPPAYSGPADLIYMPIMDMAALIKAKIVSCETVVQTFIDRLKEFDPYLAIVSLLLESEAMDTARSYDIKIASGEYMGPFMCIPFGMKDHHQIRDEVTRDGHILYAHQVKPLKSSMINTYMKHGAIPIAKMMMGAWANGPVSGWGECMSPYLSGHGGGSSCGSGSGAALGALPFAVSQETWGSIVSPVRENHISGHLASYGVFSRAGATILSPVMDHFGFHSRWIKDYAMILNYGRTGKDPNDADSMDFTFVDPASVDKSKLKVLVVIGDGKAEWDSKWRTWRWNEKVPLSAKAGMHWKARMELVMEALDAAGISYDAIEFDNTKGMWNCTKDSIFAEWPYKDGRNMFMAAYMGVYSGSTWAKIQQFYLGHENSLRRSRWGGRTLTLKLMRNVNYVMNHMGRLLLNDPIWKTYDVILTSDAYSVTQQHHSGIEEWVRTAKTFVVDYYQNTPCIHKSGKTVEGAFLTLTSLPTQDHLNFVVGTAIQEYSKIKEKIMYPDEAGIKEAFVDRTRCPTQFYADLRLDSCPQLDKPGAPLYMSSGQYAMNRGCTKGHAAQYIPDAWADSLYEAPYLMANDVPDESIYRWETYGPVACTHVCPWVPHFCEYKNITCDDDRRRLEAEHLKIMKVPKWMEEKASNAAALLEEEIRQFEMDLMED